eukprot:179399-Hanusia_phi.AAC.1
MIACKSENLYVCFDSASHHLTGLHEIDQAANPQRRVVIRSNNTRAHNTIWIVGMRGEDEERTRRGEERRGRGEERRVE